MKESKGPIGFFDSGYGGLTVMKEVVRALPDYDYIYLGDNARAPYGGRSFETVYEYTLACVKKLFEFGCPLVILACNTASAKALRTIQQKDLPTLAPDRRVLGVIRPTTEIIGNYSSSNHVGVLATTGTVNSNSYPIEIKKFFPELHVHQTACPMWVPLIENQEEKNAAADYFVKKYIDQLFQKSSSIDAVILGCTHYPLMIEKINQFLPKTVKVIQQGPIVAASLADYLKRHPEIESHIGKNKSQRFFTTETPENFDPSATYFYGAAISSVRVLI
jgi:glutamate racemase